MRRKPRHRTARCILYRGDKFLLADHNASNRHKTTATIKWGLPGGHIEWREQPLDAARREVFEELNLHLGKLTPVGDYLYKNRLHAIFAAHSDVGEFDLDFSELATVRWFTQPEIKALALHHQLHAGYEYKAVCDYLALKHNRNHSND